MNTNMTVSSRRAHTPGFHTRLATQLPPQHLLPATLSRRELRRIVAELLG